MTKIQVFDPALCCSTGICGVDVDQSLVEFAADVDWLGKQGVAIERFNLAQQPLAFANHATIRNLLQSEGEPALPVILVDDVVMHRGKPYPSRSQLAKWAGIRQADSKLSSIAITAAGSAPSQGGCCGGTSAPASSTPSKCC